MDRFEMWKATVLRAFSLPDAERNRQLLLWLEGYETPSDEIEGYTFVLSVVLTEPEARNSAAAFAAEQVDALRQGSLKARRDPNRLIYNLLSLCSELAMPKVLGRPLRELLSAWRQEASWAETAFMGIRIVHILRSALIHNQEDDTFAELWRSLLDDNPDPLLQGIRMDGFEGTIGLPASPDLHSRIGYALQRMAKFLENPEFQETDQWRQKKFDALIQLAVSRHRELDERLIGLAIDHHWPRWTRYGRISAFDGLAYLQPGRLAKRTNPFDLIGNQRSFACAA